MKTQGQRRSRRQEQRTAEDVGGRVTAGSGATRFSKGDVKAPDLRVECKTTAGDSYSLKRKDLEKLRNETIAEGGLESVFQVEFRRGPGWNERYAVIDWQEYLDLRKARAELEDLHNHVARRDT